MSVETSDKSSSLNDQDLQIIRDELALIRDSRFFAKSPSLVSLLEFLIREQLSGNGANLKETYVGYHHFKRAADYDPKLDSLVRVNANRLRLRLEAFYSDRSSGFVKISIPRGTYVPRYEWKALLESDDRTPETADSEAASSETQSETTVPDTEEPFANGFKTVSGRRLLTPLTCSVVAAVGLVFFLAIRILKYPQSPRNSYRFVSRPFTRMQGIQTFAAFSPDQRDVAFAWSKPDEANRSDIYVQNIETKQMRRLTNGVGENTRPAWSPDGRRLAYVNLTNGVKQLQVIDLEDRRVRVIAPLAGDFPWLCQVSRLAWDQAGTHIFTTGSPAEGAPCQIVSIAVKDGSLRSVSRPTAPAVADVEPAVSPDGRRLAFIRNTGTMVGDLYLSDLDGSNLQQVTHDQRDISGFSWDHESKGFLTASRRADGILRLWHVPLGGGAPQRITEGLAEVAFPAESPDGKRVVLTEYHEVRNIWRVWSDGRKPERLIADESTNADAAGSPDGRSIAFRSNRSGSIELWRSDQDGQNASQLTFFNGPMPSRVVWSPDGKRLAFECRDNGHLDVCTMPSKGGRVSHIVDWFSNQEQPAWSNDGRSVYFISNRTGKKELYRATVEHGSVDQVTFDGAVRGMSSLHSASFMLAKTTSQPGIYVLSGSKGNEHLLHSMPSSLLLDQWAASPDGIWYLQRSEGNRQEVALISFASSTGKETRLASIAFEVPEGDQAFTIEAGGRSALLVEEGAHGANLALLSGSGQ